MSEAFKIILSLSVSGTLLYLLLTLLMPLCKRFVSKTGGYLLYLVVIVRLLLPWAPNGSLIVRLLGAASARPSLTSPITPTAAPLQETAAALTNMPAALPLSPLAAHPTLWEIAAVIWLAVAILLLLGKLLSYGHYSHMLRIKSSPVNDPQSLQLLAELRAQYGLRRQVGLAIYPPLGTPVLLGVIRPLIVLPAEVPSAELAYILRHELVHCQRGDFWYKWLVQFTVCVHWFNPFVHHLSRTIGHAGELACDEQVLRRLSESDRVFYGTTLLHALQRSQGQKSVPQLLALTSNGRRFQERLASIMSFKRSTKTTLLLTLLLTTFICTTAAATGAYTPAAPAPEQQPSPKGFTYTQSGYYQDSYIIQLGWNISESSADAYPTRAALHQPDGSTLTAYFADEACAYAQDDRLLAALSQTIAAVKDREHTADGLLPLQMPLVVQVDGPYTQSPQELAAQFYQEKSLVHFMAVYAVLDEADRSAYAKRIYQDDRVSFFGAACGRIPLAALEEIAAQAYADGSHGFFSIALSDLPPETIQMYADAAYTAKDIAAFSITSGYLTDEQKAAFRTRAQKDKDHRNFLYVLSD